MATREPEGASTAGRLSATEVTDEADVSPRAAEQKLAGKRVRGIPAIITKSGDRGTLIEIRPIDVSTAGGPELKHTLRFDTKRESGTVVVGTGNGQVPNDVAEFLTSNYPTSFEYMNE